MSGINVGGIPNYLPAGLDTWNPGKLGSSLLAWYAADQILGVNSTGAEIGTWQDLGPNGCNATQASTGLRPVLEYVSAAGFVGWIVRADGVDDVLVTADIGARDIGSICVIGGNVGNGASAPAFATIDMGLAGDLRIATMLTNDLTMYTGDVNDVWGTSFTIYVNNTATEILAACDTYQVIALTGNDVTASTGLLYLLRATINDFIEGDVAELIFLNSTMTANEQTLLQNYARDKYGITI